MESMTTKGDGGPAFPGTQSSKFYFPIGMSLRDYFAAKAMQGIKANSDHCESTAARYEELAEESYGIADAMLEARSK